MRVCVCVCVHLICVNSFSPLFVSVFHVRDFLSVPGDSWVQVHGWEFFHSCSVTQLCLTLCNPMDCSSPGSPVHGISWAKILEWVAISFSRGSNPCLLYLVPCQWILYWLSHRGNPSVRMGLHTLEDMASLGLQKQLPLSNWFPALKSLKFKSLLLSLSLWVYTFEKQ